MSAYADTGFILSILVRSKGAALASEILSHTQPPLPINSLHALQVENFFTQNASSGEKARTDLAEQAAKTWIQWLAEGVFLHTEVNWEKAFQLARIWNRDLKSHPTLPLLLLHPALALVSEASEFLSFDPRARGAARHAGLKVLPTEL